MRKWVVIFAVAVLATAGGLVAYAGIKGIHPWATAAVIESAEGDEPIPVPAVQPTDNLGDTLPVGLELKSSVQAKPLGDTVKKGLAFLVSQQHNDGGWGQGGGWRAADKDGGRVEGPEVQDPSDVGNTCIATLALLRAGNTATDGPHAKNVARGIAFICKNVQQSDKESLYVTSVRNTQLQSKIGPTIDTFLAVLVLAEIKGTRLDDQCDPTLVAALNKTVSKMEKNQKADGTWIDDGWAPVIAQGIATKGLNRYGQFGQIGGQFGQFGQFGDNLSEKTLERTERWGQNQFAAQFSGGGGAGGGLGGMPAPTGFTGPGDAGVPLYSLANSFGGVAESAITNRLRKAALEKVAADTSLPQEQRAKARKDLERFKETEVVLAAQTRALVQQLDRGEFVAGFGSNGGEEFLSYMTISEALLVSGGEAWEKWDKKMTDGLTRAHDQDGSWSGHHCITGKTFCTAAALLVLMADRTPIPVLTTKKDSSK